MDNNEDKEIISDSNLVPVIMYIPSNAISIEITARIIDSDENISTAVSKWNMKELNTAKIEGDQWEADNVKYVITDLGRKQLEDLARKKLEKLELEEGI